MNHHRRTAGGEPAIKRYTVNVKRWVLYEETVSVEATSERAAREEALRQSRTTRGVITKNRTTIVSPEST